jgi:hypothetical protein
MYCGLYLKSNLRGLENMILHFTKITQVQICTIKLGKIEHTIDICRLNLIKL